MPASINKQGYIRITFLGFDKPLTIWRGQSIRPMPIEEKQKLCEFFNMAILSGKTEAVKMWFPRERAKHLMKNICWIWLEYKLRRPATIAQYTILLKRYIVPQVGNKTIHEFTRQDFYWIRQIHGDTEMARQVRKICQAILNWAWKEGMMDRQLFLPIISVPKKPTPYIELRDRWRIYDRVNPEYQDPILFSIEMGMRIGEILALRWDAIDFKHERIKVFRVLSAGVLVDMRKGGDEIWLPMSTRIKTMLENRRQIRKNQWVFSGKWGNHLWPQTVTKAFKRAARECGLPHARLHHCRNSFAIDLISAGYSLEEVGAYLGQRHRSTTEQYKGFGIRKLRPVRKMELS